MKKPMYILAVAASLFMVACGSESEDVIITEENIEATEEVVVEEVASIVGTWQMTAMDLGMEAPAGKEEEFAASMQKSIDATSYAFNEDGTMTVNSEIGLEEGSYTIDGSTLAVVTIRTELLEINELTGTRLILAMSGEGMNGTLTFERK